MVKVFENDLGTLQVTFLDVETLICGYKQNTRQIWAYEPGTPDPEKILCDEVFSLTGKWFQWNIFITGRKWGKYRFWIFDPFSKKGSFNQHYFIGAFLFVFENQFSKSTETSDQIEAGSLQFQVHKFLVLYLSN